LHAHGLPQGTTTSVSAQPPGQRRLRALIPMHEADFGRLRRDAGDKIDQIPRVGMGGVLAAAVDLRADVSRS